MAINTKDTDGRVTLVATEVVTGVILERTIQQNTVRIRPTNTTATINIVAATGTVTQAERDAAKLILLHNGPKGGFTQTGAPGAGDFLVSDNVAAVITDR